MGVRGRPNVARNARDFVAELNPNRFTGLGNKYSQDAPAGFNGRFMWLRITLGRQLIDP